jgi:transcriptional regulator with XRE-family HTH domain
MSNLKALRSLTDLGQNLRQARLSRRFSIAELATRADVSERTLIRLEKGDPGVGIGNLAGILAALGSPHGLADLMSPENDPVGLSRALDAVPKRGRSFKPAKTTQAEAGSDEAPPASKPERKGVSF